jgi:hypothetical protein
MKRSLVLAAALLLLGGLCVSASADPTVDQYSINMQNAARFVSGGGSGFDGGQWYSYSLDNIPLRAQWFYDDPPDPTRWKEISYSFDISSTGGTVGKVDAVGVAINWTTMDYPAVGRDGPIPTQADVDAGFVDAEIVFLGLVDEEAPVHFSGSLKIPEFNPEWVSVDVTVLPPFLAGWPMPPDGPYPDPLAVYSVVGTITHECVPEPSTIAILASGLLAVVVFARRRR